MMLFELVRTRSASPGSRKGPPSARLPPTSSSWTAGAFPQDISFVVRYAPNLSSRRRSRQPWSPMSVAEVLVDLRRHGLRVHADDD